MIAQGIGSLSGPRIAVVGVGGAGCNVASSFVSECCPVDTIAINTDKEGLHRTSADLKLYICKEVLHGEGTGGNAVIGKRCADIHKEEIRQALSGYDAVFVIGGLGGGTGTGAMPVVIDEAKAQGAMTFAIAISPFTLEGQRKTIAKEAWRHIAAMCESSILVDNDKVLDLMKNLTMDRAFAEVNRSIRVHVISCIKSLNEKFSSVEIRREKVRTETAERSSLYPINSLIST